MMASKWKLEVWKMVLYMGFPVAIYYGYNRYTLSLEVDSLIKKEEAEGVLLARSARDRLRENRS